jgi:hypothetical protein
MRSARTAPAPIGSASDSAHFTQLVLMMAGQTKMAEQLIVQHSNDGTGHCRRCTTGAQAGRHIWPCQTYLAARQAQLSTMRSG